MKIIYVLRIHWALQTHQKYNFGGSESALPQVPFTLCEHRSQAGMCLCCALRWIYLSRQVYSSQVVHSYLLAISFTGRSLLWHKLKAQHFELIISHSFTTLQGPFIALHGHQAMAQIWFLYLEKYLTQLTNYTLWIRLDPSAYSTQYDSIDRVRQSIPDKQADDNFGPEIPIWVEFQNNVDPKYSS